ncbi:MAG: hypothetical protein QME94_12785, partial [Anaerolineae bacterium]|nr:hypothetical protein [Anaerolineae bacterium]
ELSARRGHGLANGHVAALARQAGAGLVVNSDAHEPSDLVSLEAARRVALGAGLTAAEAEDAVVNRPAALLKQALERRQR